ncbi:tRNA lysidine(34) synthetase TilS [Xenophilus arseniciresistens]|uniref:tRNA(Ile)-lysidine synthase n=1 Tax=Xenophilus arseniciresistens TaxID=1283306 RepID=A0AAE3N8F3_9BURK|nr:tRNA lysidine(34) synthetase TilS [Xenophilus arseniciresistens]MDA7415184.1 tRNA lysidine(34) synthetase TilS [Xenophilus arseniciresistens]
MPCDKSCDFDAAIARFEPPLPLAVALSGGADSTALLRACAARWPGQVKALHVNHGLQAAADDFERHCIALCARLQVPLRITRVNARHGPGQSPEEAARQARYAALAALALDEGVAAVALGHHADDQAETLLLALSRGAGLRGLSAMPAQMQRHGVPWWRPLLAVGADEIRSWLRARGQAWVEDPSNADAQYTRNRIRTQVLPALAAALPAFRQTFARSAAHAAQAQAVLDEVADEDLARVGQPPRIAALQALSQARQAHVLRRWLAGQDGPARAAYPSSAQLQALLVQIAACRTRGHRIELRVGSGQVRRDADVLRWYNCQPSPPAPPLAGDSGPEA